jgi:UDP-N-acetylglucosamine acyltransferase
MSVTIAAGAAVDPRAEIDDEVQIGPFCTVGPHVRIGRGTKLENSVSILGRVTIGRDNLLYPGAVVGGAPQDVGYRGGDTQVVIGDRNTIREHVTINRASEKEDGLTLLGDDNYLMAGCHVAHDCRVGNGVVIANDTLLGGHVHVHDFATLSAGIGIHQFTTVGSYSFIAGLSRVLQDVPPFLLVEGSPAKPRCVNLVALKRRGFSHDAIRALAEAHRLLYREKAGLERTRESLCTAGHLLPEVLQLLNFLHERTDGRHGRSREKLRKAA